MMGVVNRDAVYEVGTTLTGGALAVACAVVLRDETTANEVKLAALGALSLYSLCRSEEFSEKSLQKRHVFAQGAIRVYRDVSNAAVGAVGAVAGLLIGSFVL
jgi:hypothetical protein